MKKRILFITTYLLIIFLPCFLESNEGIIDSKIVLATPKSVILFNNCSFVWLLII